MAIIHYGPEVPRRSVGVPRRVSHGLAIENYYKFLIRAPKCKIMINLVIYEFSSSSCKQLPRHQPRNCPPRLQSSSWALGSPAPAAAGLWAVHGRRLTHSASKRQHSRKHCSERSKPIPAQLRQTSDRKTLEIVVGPFFSWSRDPVRCQKRTGEPPRRPLPLAGFEVVAPRKTLIPCPSQVVTPCPNVRIVGLPHARLDTGNGSQCHVSDLAKTSRSSETTQFLVRPACSQRF